MKKGKAGIEEAAELAVAGVKNGAGQKNHPRKFQNVIRSQELKKVFLMIRTRVLSGARF